MELSVGRRRTVTKTIATRYERADKATTGVIRDALCAMAGWHRNHAREALSASLKPNIVSPARAPK